MPETIRKLLEEHRNITKLLEVLETQLSIFNTTEQPDYDVLLAIADYFMSFPDLCHHPKEDLVYRKLRERDPAGAERLGDLEAEHEKIAVLARHFREAVGNVLDEVEVPRGAFDVMLRDFINTQRKHLEMEEEQFFPLALKALTPDDWTEIDARVTREEDPVFGETVTEEFEALRAEILKWEREDEAEAG